MAKQITKTLKEIAALVNGQVLTGDTTVITGITSAIHPQPGCITYVTDPKLVASVDATNIAALIVPPQSPACSKPTVVVSNPKLAWAQLLAIFHPSRSYEPMISD